MPSSAVIYYYIMMFPRLFPFGLFMRFKRKNIPNLVVPLQTNFKKMLTTSGVSASGIETGTITNLPSGVIGKEENINGQTLFSIEEGLAKVYFPATTPEEVFYNPGMCFKRNDLRPFIKEITPDQHDKVI